jgi:hypothetical protein
MSKYKYWSTDKLLTLLKELELSVSGSHLKDLYLKDHVENILYQRLVNNES